MPCQMVPPMAYSEEDMLVMGSSSSGEIDREGWRRVEGKRNTYAHAESTAKVIENDPGAGVTSVIHGWLWVCGRRGASSAEARGRATSS